MEKLIVDIQTYCFKHGITPQLLLRRAINANWRKWEEWQSGSATASLATADKLRDYMSRNS